MGCITMACQVGGACEADGSHESQVKDKMWTSEQQDKHKAKCLKDPIYTSLN